MKTPTVLNLLETPLEGVRLIEASAGTGKTYTIAGLFIRLVVEQAMTVDRILVVTYTRAATEELKQRIRTRLTEALRAFGAGTSTDPLLGPLVHRTADRTQACRNLDRAVRDFDRACIFTIHGFCQRVLAEHAFETGVPFDFELVPNPANLHREVAEDYWRRHFYNAPAEVVAYAAAQGRAAGPEHYQRLIDRSTADLKVIPAASDTSLPSLDSYRRRYRRLASAWPALRGEVLEILNDPALNGRLYGTLPHKRAQVLGSLAEAMDRFTENGQPGFPPFARFHRFTAAGLQAATRKGCRTPRHRFFELCQELMNAAETLAAEIDRHLHDLDIGFFRYAAGELDRRKRLHNVLFYDDLLRVVRNALAESDGPLLETVRSRYPAALVDEFQDTDSIQCEIFLRLFTGARPDGLLFMIGDPKQSIYSFRGSDIFSYLEAAQQARRTYTLHRNWRSDPALVQAVNSLFTNAPRPFVYSAIGFEPGTAGHTRNAARPPRPAMDLWYFPGGPDRPMNKTDAVRRITAAVADEILRLAARPAEAAHPGEIAVLVRSNDQGRRMKAALDARGIPAVLHGAGNVFDTHEAAELQRLLTGVCEPNREDAFRSALVTDLLGVTASQLAAADADSAAWEARRARFREYAAVWQRSGFMPMFRRILSREGVLERLLGLLEGERRLTNLLHLAELLQEESLRRPPSMAGLVRWLIDQRSAAAPRREEQLLRLESDARAVKILTIHRSKGLEFPVVFCPFTWHGSRLRATDEVRCHDAATQRPVLDLGSEHIETHRRQAETEMLAENLRLLYVAVTRARSRCYLIWGRFNTAETSATAYLLHNPSDAAGDTNPVDRLQTHVAGLDDSARIDDLRALAARSQGSIAVSVQPEEFEPVRASPAPAAESLHCRPFTGRIDRHWQVTSYSALVSQNAPEEERPDTDLAAVGAKIGEMRRPADDPDFPAAERSIERFPRGARAGIFFHDLLQQIPFCSPVPQEFLVTKLHEYHFDDAWLPEVDRLLSRVMQTELMPGLRLGSVNHRRRVHEMEFYLPLQELTPQDLQAIFPNKDTQLPESYSIQMEGLDFAPVRGYLKGFVDLIFEHGGRYFLLDWKSNDLGSGKRHYAPDALARVMSAERYVLQYLLYTVAVDRYLRKRKPDYDYRRHFGGVFYLFLRGISDEPADRTGIFYDLPDPGAIATLGRQLIGE